MPDQSNDGRHLSIFILGPMPQSGEVDSSCQAIKFALNSIIAEPEVQRILRERKVSAWDVEEPGALYSANIIHDVFARIDEADLVVINLTPKDGPAGQSSPNVFYELGLVHSLGVPYILLSQEATPIPFYLRDSRIHLVKDFSEGAVRRALRDLFLRFLRGEASDQLADNRISDFYSLPVVDISAAVGAATAYYENLIQRALLENGFIGHYPDRFSHLIVCRPNDIINRTAVQEMQEMKRFVKDTTGADFRRETFEPVFDYDKRALAGDFIGTVMVDLPTVAYTMRMSPRFRSLQDRVLEAGDEPPPRLRQASERLLDKFEEALHYHRRRERNLRSSALSFCRVLELPGKLRELGAVPR